MKKKLFLLLMYLKNTYLHSELDQKPVWKDIDASWEIICCKAFLRHGESPPLTQSQGRWVRQPRQSGGSEGEAELVLTQETGKGRDKATVPSQNNLKGNIFCFKFI